VRQVDKAKARSQHIIPLEDGEVPFVEEVGRCVDALMRQARYRTVDLALASEVSRSQLYNIRAGLTRTRSSTLLRIATAIAERLGMNAIELHGQLLELGGTAIAPETAYPERVNNRREKRNEKNRRRVETRAYHASILRELRRKPINRPIPLRGPDGRWLPKRPTPERIAELEKHYASLQMVPPPRDTDGNFIKDSPLLGNRTARDRFNPPKRLPTMPKRG
jgi:hypothetical protein